MVKLYVADTNSIIRFFRNFFNQPQKLSRRAQRIFEDAILPYNTDIRLSIPSVVFVELYEKWLKTEEVSAKFRYEVFQQISDSPNIEIKPIEKEVLECMTQIRDRLQNHDLHDKIIVASAIMLQCPIITADTVIRKYVEETRVIPEVIF